MTIETFSEWKREAERILISWHRDDAGRVGEEHWCRCFERGYVPWEAARYASDLLHHAPNELRRRGMAR